MLDEKELTRIEEKIKKFFNQAGFEVELEMNYLQEDGDVLEVNIINLEDAKMFIGKQGLMLADIQLLLRKVIKKEIEKEIYLALDIDNYRKDKTNNYKSMANSAAEEVATTGQQRTLPPLSAYARRIIHMELAKRDDVVTESIGEGEGRRVTIKPRII